jgi:hypothetical protein
MLRLRKPLSYQSQFYLCTVILFYTVVGAILLPYYRYQINPDGISYISIANKYLAGNYREAINGYWSPLFSWLLMPWLYFKIDPLLAVKIINLLIGIVAITTMYSFTFRYQISEQIRCIILFVLIPVTIYFSYDQITPDLLTAVLLLFYFNVIFNIQYPIKPHYGALCGIIGSIAYLSKHYCFPFFIIHFPIMNALHYVRNSSPICRKSILRHFCIGLSLFLIISSPWIYALSHKYNNLLFSTAGNINLANLNPNASRYQLPSFIDPPDMFAYSAWDDPYYALRNLSWNPFESLVYMKHWLEIFIFHATQTLKIFINFSFFSFLLFCGCIVYCAYLLFSKPIKLNTLPEIVFSLATTLIYSAGYCLIHVEARFFMIICFLFMVFGGYGLNKIIQNSLFKMGKSALFILFFLSFSILPINHLIKNVNSGKAIYLLSTSLEKYIPPNSKIATTGYWYESLYLTFHLQSKIYGTTEHMQAEVAKRELDKYGIKYFIDWGVPGDRSLLLSEFSETGRGKYNDRPVIAYKRKGG